MQVALGDHQVANVAAEVEARTIGARLRTPAVDAGRSFDKEPFYGIKPIRWFPFDGSAFVMCDTGPVRPDGVGGVIGTPPAPITNTPPREGKRSALRPAQRRERAHPEVRVPEDRRPRDRRLRHAPVLRRRAGPGPSAGRLGCAALPRAPTPSSRPSARSARMPASSASQGPRGASPTSWSRSASYSASFCAVRLELGRRERRGVGAEEELQQAVVAQLGELARGRLAATRRGPRGPCR